MPQTLISPEAVSGTEMVGRRLADEKLRAARAASSALSQAREHNLSATSVTENPRIAALKKAIADGRYALDAEAIAEGMVQIERQLSE